MMTVKFLGNDPPPDCWVKTPTSIGWWWCAYPVNNEVYPAYVDNIPTPGIYSVKARVFHPRLGLQEVYLPEEKVWTGGDGVLRAWRPMVRPESPTYKMFIPGYMGEVV